MVLYFYHILLFHFNVIVSLLKRGNGSISLFSAKILPDVMARNVFTAVKIVPQPLRNPLLDASPISRHPAVKSGRRSRFVLFTAVKMFGPLGESGHVPLVPLSKAPEMEHSEAGLACFVTWPDQWRKCRVF